MGGSCLEWRMAQQCLQTALFYPWCRTSPTGIGSARPVWTRLNHLWTGVGRFAHPCTNGEWSLQRSLGVAWRIKLDTILYKDANTCHQMASMFCRSWIMTPPNGSPPHVPTITSSLDGLGLMEDSFLLHKLNKQLNESIALHSLGPRPLYSQQALGVLHHQHKIKWVWLVTCLCIPVSLHRDTWMSLQLIMA